MDRAQPELAKGAHPIGLTPTAEPVASWPGLLRAPSRARPSSSVLTAHGPRRDLSNLVFPGRAARIQAPVTAAQAASAADAADLVVLSAGVPVRACVGTWPR